MAVIKLNQDSLKPRREFKRHQIQPGHNIYRILPPFGDEEVHNNYPYKKWTIVWMNDPESGRRRPYALPAYEKDNPDPVSMYVRLLSEKIETAKEAMKAKGVPDEVIREKLGDVNKLVWELRPKAGFFYNACNKAGEVGILEIKKTAHDALKAEMYQYIKDYSQDPTSLSSTDDDSGVWFNIIREGEKGDKNTEYSVKKNQFMRKDARGKPIFEDDRDALPEHVANNFDSLGYDIYNLYQAKTHVELMELLMFNLRAVIKEIPFARIEGFDPAQYESAAEAEEPPFTPDPEPMPKATPSKPAPKLALGDDADDMEAAILGTKPVAKAVPAKAAPKAKTEDDVFALADSILNG